MSAPEEVTWRTFSAAGVPEEQGVFSASRVAAGSRLLETNQIKAWEAGKGTDVLCYVTGNDKQNISVRKN